MQSIDILGLSQIPDTKGSTVGVAAPLLFLIALLVGTTVATRRGARALPVAATRRLREAARTTRRWRLGLLLAAPLCALCILAGVVGGELRVTAPQGPVRIAALEVRHLRDYLPRRLTAVVAGATALMALVLGLTTATGSPDDLGRAGRSFARRCSAVSAGSTGPWPGSYYSVPLAIVVLAGLLLAGFAVWRVVQRPRQGEDTAVDDGLRRQAAEAVTAACGLLVSIPFAGVALISASALGNHVCPPGGSSGAVVALLLLVPALVLLAAWCVGVLVAPAGTGRAADMAAAAQP
jgi:hypothetical protein